MSILRQGCGPISESHESLWLWVPAFAGTTNGSLRRGRLGAGAVALVDIVDHHRLEFGGDIGAAQGAEFLAVDEYRRRRGLAGAGQRNADIGMLGFAGTVDDAAHDRNVERFDPGIARLPAGHLIADEILDAARQFLEGGRGGAAAA